jgi:hypothetical protein
MLAFSTSFEIRMAIPENAVAAMASAMIDPGPIGKCVAANITGSKLRRT